MTRLDIRGNRRPLIKYADVINGKGSTTMSSEFVKTCEVCQRHVRNRYEEPMKAVQARSERRAKIGSRQAQRGSRRYARVTRTIIIIKPTWTVIIWAKIGVDVVYMPLATGGYGFIVFSRDDLSGWVEGHYWCGQFSERGQV